MNTRTNKALTTKKINQLHKVIDYIILNKKNHFYINKLKLAEIYKSSDLLIHNFSKIPFTSKAELIADQMEHPPYGTNCSIQQVKYSLIRTSSGTTRLNPLILPQSDQDLHADLIFTPEWIKSIGLKSREDKIFFMVPRGLFYKCQLEAEAAHISSVAIDQFSIEQILTRIVKLNVTTIEASPTEILILGKQAKEFGVDPTHLPIKTIITSGEYGGTNPHIRKKIETMWNAKSYDLYGSTENGVIASECHRQCGPHLLDNKFIIEVIDPTTNLPANRGELVLTNLYRYDYPLIRYRTGDIVELLTDTCKCGNHAPRLKNGVESRQDAKIRIGDQFFSASDLENIILSNPKILTFQLVLLPAFNMSLKLAFINDPDPKVIKRIQQQMYYHFNTVPIVTTVNHETITSLNWKTNRIIDNRIRGKNSNPKLSSKIKKLFGWFLVKLSLS